MHAEVSLWDIVHQEQLQALTRMPPINAFDEMIQWTQEGKLWHFPINNEQGKNHSFFVGVLCIRMYVYVLISDVWGCHLNKVKSKDIL